HDPERAGVPRTGRAAAPRVIAVTSGKGGVGKTNIVANLGYAFTRLGKKVLILDADLGLGNLDVLL
ncbi:MAG: MinD/ParA family protein, partial [candidate division Zixibacteria bacterium]|nr:MinD/ParA family protein [candidate division Zixibacteria bacterium]NIW47318.1 P-loop NTPase [Gammaproteobacteria bacterium]